MRSASNVHTCQSSPDSEHEALRCGVSIFREANIAAEEIGHEAHTRSVSARTSELGFRRSRIHQYRIDGWSRRARVALASSTDASGFIVDAPPARYGSIAVTLPVGTSWREQTICPPSTFAPAWTTPRVTGPC